MVDLTVKLAKPATYEEICQKVKEASVGKMKGILGYCEVSNLISQEKGGIQKNRVRFLKKIFFTY